MKGSPVRVRASAYADESREPASTAVRELLTLNRAIGTDRLKIVRPRGYAATIFEVTGLGEHLPLVDDPADAPAVEAGSRDSSA